MELKSRLDPLRMSQIGLFCSASISIISNPMRNHLHVLSLSDSITESSFYRPDSKKYVGSLWLLRIIDDLPVLVDFIEIERKHKQKQIASQWNCLQSQITKKLYTSHSIFVTFVILAHLEGQDFISKLHIIPSSIFILHIIS
jgi:hypothetical protein